MARQGVVVGIDGSAESRAALRFALEEGARRDTTVRVVSALLPVQYRPEAYGLTGPPDVAELKADLRATARRAVADAVAEEPRLACVPVELHEVVGRPAVVLVEQARGADLLVVGHRGRGGFTSAMLGSVGLQCVLHAPCAVTVVRPAAQPVSESRPEGATLRARLDDAVVGPLY